MIKQLKNVLHPTVSNSPNLILSVELSKHSHLIRYADLLLPLVNERILCMLKDVFLCSVCLTGICLLCIPMLYI